MRMLAVVLTLASVVVFRGAPADAVDLNGKWYFAGQPGGPEFVDVVQTGSTVTATFAGLGALSGTLSGSDLGLSNGQCEPPTDACAFVYEIVLSTGDDAVGYWSIGFTPLPTTGGITSNRCECYDGNTTNGDGCDATCRVEPCFTCSGMPSTCTPVADGGACEDGSPCTTGETCTGGACGGGSPVSPCVDMTGLWAAHVLHYVSGLFLEGIDVVRNIRQRGSVLQFGDFMGTIDATTGAFSVQ